MSQTPADEFVRALEAHATSTSFPARAPTLSVPGGIDLAGGGRVPGRVLLVAYGTGSENATFGLRAIGWRKGGATWVPATLAEVTATLGTTLGVTGGVPGASDRLCDTLAVVTGTADVGLDAVSPGDNTPAHLVLDVRGCSRLELLFRLDSGATGANALVARL